MCRVPHYGLVHIPDLNVDPAIYVSYRPEITGVTITTDPDIGSNRKRCLDLVTGQPFIKLNGIASDVGMGGFRHLEVTLTLQHGKTIFERCRQVLQ